MMMLNNLNSIVAYLNIALVIITATDNTLWLISVSFLLRELLFGLFIFFEVSKINEKSDSLLTLVLKLEVDIEGHPMYPTVAMPSASSAEKLDKHMMILLMTNYLSLETLSFSVFGLRRKKYNVFWQILAICFDSLSFHKLGCESE